MRKGGEGGGVTSEGVGVGVAGCSLVGSNSGVKDRAVPRLQDYFVCGCVPGHTV